MKHHFKTPTAPTSKPRGYKYLNSNKISFKIFLFIILNGWALSSNGWETTLKSWETSGKVGAVGRLGQQIVRII